MIQGYDQDRFAEVMRYQERPIEPSLQAFRYARESTAQLFDLMTEADWRKLGWHSEAGVQVAAAVRERVRRHVHDAHHQHTVGEVERDVAAAPDHFLSAAFSRSICSAWPWACLA